MEGHEKLIERNFPVRTAIYKLTRGILLVKRSKINKVRELIKVRKCHVYWLTTNCFPNQKFSGIIIFMENFRKKFDLSKKKMILFPANKLTSNWTLSLGGKYLFSEYCVLQNLWFEFSTLLNRIYCDYPHISICLLLCLCYVF